MMRRWFFSIVLLSSLAHAKDCHLWKVRGKVTYERPSFLLKSADHTLSETKLILPVEIQHKLTDFMDQFVEATVLITEADLPRKTTVLSVEAVERAVADPLRDNKSTLFKKQGVRPCP